MNEKVVARFRFYGGYRKFSKRANIPFSFPHTVPFLFEHSIVQEEEIIDLKTKLYLF